MFNCVYCNKEFSNKGSMASHSPYCKYNPNSTRRKISPEAGAKKGSIPWNKGIPTSNSVKEKISKSLTGIAKGISSSDEGEILRRNKISETMKKNPDCGGVRKGSGRGIKGRYKGIWCDSTWELAWVIYHFDHKIKFKRNHEGFFYEYNNEIHTYYPDFKIKNSYVEVKGRRKYSDLNEKEKSKIDSFTGKIIVLYQSEMKEILDYVISNYGKDFKRLYE